MIIPSCECASVNVCVSQQSFCEQRCCVARHCRVSCAKHSFHGFWEADGGARLHIYQLEEASAKQRANALRGSEHGAGIVANSCYRNWCWQLRVAIKLLQVAVVGPAALQAASMIFLNVKTTWPDGQELSQVPKHGATRAPKLSLDRAAFSAQGGLSHWRR